MIWRTTPSPAGSHTISFFKNEGVASCLFHFASQIDYFTGKYTININFSTDCDFFTLKTLCF